MQSVVDRPEQLTARWLSEALQACGRDLTVSEVRFDQVGTGQMGTTYRLELAYEGSEGCPTLIAKMAGEDETMRSFVAPGYAAEVGFYATLSPTLNVRTPGCQYAAISADKTRFTLLLEHITPARVGVQAQGCTVEQASLALSNLIGLHAPRWSDPTLWELDFLMRSDEDTAATMAQVMSSAAEGFIERYSGQLAREDAETLRNACAVIERWQLDRPRHFSVIHGDYRLDNLLFDLVTGEVTAVDWQTAAIGPPLRDVAYFLGTCLPSKMRRSNEEDLVAQYHSGLLESGVAGYDADQCWHDYRCGQLQGPMISVIGCMYAAARRTNESDEMFLTMAHRSCTAVRDLGSIDLV